VRGAVDLDKLPEAGPPGSRRLATSGALRAGDPEAGRRHPAAQRFHGDHETVLLRELLLREGRPEIRVSLADHGQRLVAGRGRDAPIARSAATAGREPLGAVAPEGPVEPPDLARAQPEQRGGSPAGQPALRELGHDLQSIQFPHRQRHRLRHGAIEAAGRTFLLWRNRTFALGAYMAGPIKDDSVNSGLCGDFHDGAQPRAHTRPVSGAAEAL
jgi:hypothetical protein